MSGQGKTQRGALSLLLLCPFLLAVLVPFLWMVLGIFKTNNEFFQPLGKAFFPVNYEWQNVNELLDGKWVPFWDVFGNSLVVSFGQALGAVTLSAMAGYAFARFTFSGKRLLFVLAVALILVPRQLFAVPLFSWVNEIGLSDSLFGVMLPGVVTGLGVIYFTQVFRQVPEEYLQAARICGATELRVFLTVLPLVWPALLSYGMIHFILTWHEQLVPMLVLTTETKQTLPLALAKLYDVSQRTPQGVQMAASTFAVIPTAVLFALCCLMILVCRVWKRNRYYKKVQHSLDEEERAFQE